MSQSVSAPPRPIPAVLAVVIRDDRVLLVQRANPPDAGLWGFPGGKIELGEPLLAATERELLEETGVKATARQVIEAVDAFHHAEDERLLQQFVLIAVLCDWIGGEPAAADDALDARWIPLRGMEEALEMSRDVARIAHLAARIG